LSKILLYICIKLWKKGSQKLGYFSNKKCPQKQSPHRQKFAQSGHPGPENGDEQQGGAKRLEQLQDEEQLRRGQQGVPDEADGVQDERQLGPVL
jgi:hypothetical protein